MTDALRVIQRELCDLCAGVGRRVQVMEVCGTHTMSAARCGLHEMLPENLRLVSGPGCPVCVTCAGYIDAAIELARRGVVVATYGDMLRVPGSDGSLEAARAGGGQVVVVSSARRALEYAVSHADKEVVFLAVGFETTAPMAAATVLEAAARGVTNFTILPGHKRVVPAMMALLSTGEVRIDGFLCPGHVSVITGANSYLPVVREGRRPCVVAGFEPAQMLAGLLHLVRQIVAGAARLENVYRGIVSEDGNVTAQRIMRRVFVGEDTPWRALGVIAGSGLGLSRAYQRFDAKRRFGVETSKDIEPLGCQCGGVIQGKALPTECSLFGKRCTPMTPIGPCMVSGEGACAAWHRYGVPRWVRGSVDRSCASAENP